MTDANSRFHRFFWPALVFALCLPPWFVVEHIKAINWDSWWMTLCAGRYVNGQSSTQGFFHEEMPLATLVHIPAYLLSHYMNIPFVPAIFWTTCLYLFISCTAVFYLARRLLPDDEPFIFALLAALAGTTPLLAEFGERDQMIVMGLLPFVLGQLMLTYRIECPKKLLLPVFAAGAILVLLKPHHGLLPTLLIVHRAWTQKRWSVVRDMDFIALAVATSGYLAVIWFFFNDWATQVLPDAVKLYLGAYTDMKIVIIYAVGLAFIYGLIFIVYQMLDDQNERRRQVINLMIFAAFASIVPWIVQMKDFLYHLVPAFTFGWVAAGYALLVGLQRILPQQWAVCLTLAIVAATGYATNPVNTHTTPSAYATAAEMEAQPITRLVKSCAPDCSFVVFTVGMPVNAMTSYYAGADVGWRFPDMWFLPELVQKKRDMDEGKRTNLTKDEYKRLIAKYAGLMREDLDKRKPEIVVTCPEEFDYLAVLAVDPEFPKTWARYSRDGTVPINYAPYYPGHTPDSFPTWICDVYRLKKAS